jgi:uncharacterized protein (DUF952 family)
MRVTFHLTPAERWAAAETEGFIHCTDGAGELLATAERHYRDDPSAFVALTVDLDAAGSPWRVEDARGIYPHIFGPIDRAAVLAVARVDRDVDGRFLTLEPIA